MRFKKVELFEEDLEYIQPMSVNLFTSKNQVFTLSYPYQKIAVKMAITQRGVNELRQETAILKDLSHPNIVSFYVYSKNRSAIGLEYLDNNDFYSVLYNNDGSLSYNLSKNQLKYVLHGVASGLAYLHEKNIIFNDLKPENIFMGGWSRGGYGKVKIGDFGLALKFEPNETKRKLLAPGGSPEYISPEMITEAEASKASDVYSFACVAYEAMKKLQVFSGTFPEERDFLEENRDNMSEEMLLEYQRVLHRECLYDAVAAGQRAPWVYAEEDNSLGLTYEFDNPEIRLDQETRDLIDACWLQDPAERLSVRQVLTHGFFSSLGTITPPDMNNEVGATRSSAETSPISEMEEYLEASTGSLSTETIISSEAALTQTIISVEAMALLEMESDDDCSTRCSV